MELVTVAAYTLAIALNLFVLYFGTGFLLRPKPFAEGYGVPAKPDGDAAYLTVKGVRDTTFGLLGLALLFAVGAHAEAWYMLVVAVAPLGDMLIVLRNGGTKAVAFGVHLATAIVILISAALLFAV